MGDTLKKLAYSLGLTRRVREEISDIIEEEVVVEAIPPSVEVYYPPFPYGYNRAPEVAQIIREVLYPVRLKGSREFELSDEELHRSVRVGDRLVLKYRDIYKVVSDYDGSDFSKRGEAKELAGISMESFDKL